MSLISKLNELDYKRFENYVCTFGVGRKNYCGNDKYLRFWDKNKANLYVLLGNQLIFEEPFEYNNPEIYEECTAFLRRRDNKAFFSKLADRFEEEMPEFIESISCASTNSITWFGETVLDSVAGKKPVKISKGMRYIKALSKLIDYYNLQDIKPDFEQYRIRHSMFLADMKIKGTLCISIHPMDFVTMSDNANDWSSCMSWSNDGCYRAGTVEMMNSKYVVVAYVKSENKVYSFKNIDSEEYQWNSKQFRQLFYINEDFLLAGKSYPYEHDELTNTIFQKLLNLAEANCGWTYEHKGSYDWRFNDVKFITDMMYNDMLNDTSRTYQLAYNFDGSRYYINLSGPAPCLVCGECHVLEDRDPDDLYGDEDSDDLNEVADFYNGRYETTGALVCKDCKEKTECSECFNKEAELSAIVVDELRYCRNCWNEHVRVNPLNGELFTVYRSTYSDEFFDFTLYKRADNDDDYECVSAEGGKYTRLWIPYETLRDLIRDGKTTSERVKSEGSFWSYDIYILNEDSGIDAESLKFNNLVTPEFVGLDN